MSVVVAPNQPVRIITGGTNGVSITAPSGLQGVPGKAGPPGPPGQDAQWVSMTQAVYDAMPEEDKDPNTLYVIVP